MGFSKLDFIPVFNKINFIDFFVVIVFHVSSHTTFHCFNISDRFISKNLKLDNFDLFFRSFPIRKT